MGAAAAILDPTPLDIHSAPAPQCDAGAELDLVTICILAVNRLAPATLRSAAFGKALKVVVPDPLQLTESAWPLTVIVLEPAS